MRPRTPARSAGRTKEAPVDAHIGDEIVVDGSCLGDLSRKGEVLEVRDLGGVEHYRVRWDDGQEGLFYPGPEAHLVRLGAGRDRG
jgi:Domain of unknown function (DUF1918)